MFIICSLSKRGGVLHFFVRWKEFAKTVWKGQEGSMSDWSGKGRHGKLRLIV